ncbi:hypothetical protein RDI58_020600 [Solanum bulbocastanum]|uniref:Uncharacterized protein n=1 Tax=Solanum bulbocastanum TaxID=147425 RepID=A0AAN8T7G1_SOLBU
MNMLTFKVILIFNFLFIWQCYAATPCQTVGDCNITCGSTGTPICKNNTCYCQRCDLYPPDSSIVDDESSFISKT